MAGLLYVLPDPGSGRCVGDIPAEGCVILCGMVANPSMSLTHRLIPEALSFSQACLYTTRSPLLIPLHPPLCLFLSRLHLI